MGLGVSRASALARHWVTGPGQVGATVNCSHSEAGQLAGLAHTHQVWSPGGAQARNQIHLVTSSTHEEKRGTERPGALWHKRKETWTLRDLRKFQSSSVEFHICAIRFSSGHGRCGLLLAPSWELGPLQ